MQAEKVYKDVTKERWERIRQAAAGYGIRIEENTGEGEAFMVRLRWCFGPASKSLAIAILDAGMLQPAEALNFVDGIIQSA